MTSRNSSRLKQNGFFGRYAIDASRPTAPRVCIPKGIPFMVHPDDSHEHYEVHILHVGGRWHVVDPDVIAAGVWLPGIWRASLYQAVLENEETVILPVTKPTSDEYASWHDSMMEVIELARRAWVIVESNPKARRYEGRQLKCMRVKPGWPDAGFEELVDRAFTDKVIDLQHPLVRKQVSRSLGVVHAVEESEV